MANQQPTQYSIEQLRHCQTLYQKSQENLFSSVITSGQNTIRSILLVSGGALIAIIAFINNMIDDNLSIFKFVIMKYVFWSFGLFITSIVLGLILSGIVYLNQCIFHMEERERVNIYQMRMVNNKNIDIPNRRLGIRLQYVSIAIGILAILAFLSGCLVAFYGYYQVVELVPQFVPSK